MRPATATRRRSTRPPPFRGWVSAGSTSSTALAASLAACPRAFPLPWREPPASTTPGGARRRGYRTGDARPRRQRLPGPLPQPAAPPRMGARAGDLRRELASTSARWARPSCAVCRGTSWAAPSTSPATASRSRGSEVDVRVRPEVLDSVYLPHFKRVVDEGVGSVMSAYNAVNGEWCGQNHRLLTSILKETLGLRRVRGERLGLRHPGRRRGGQRRPRPRDARPALHR